MSTQYRFPLWSSGSSSVTQLHNYPAKNLLSLLSTTWRSRPHRSPFVRMTVSARSSPCRLLRMLLPLPLYRRGSRWSAVHLHRTHFLHNPFESFSSPMVAPKSPWWGSLPYQSRKSPIVSSSPPLPERLAKPGARPIGGRRVRRRLPLLYARQPIGLTCLRNPIGAGGTACGAVANRRENRGSLR